MRSGDAVAESRGEAGKGNVFGGCEDRGKLDRWQLLLGQGADAKVRVSHLPYRCTSLFHQAECMPVRTCGCRLHGLVQADELPACLQRFEEPEGAEGLPEGAHSAEDLAPIGVGNNDRPGIEVEGSGGEFRRGPRRPAGRHRRVVEQMRQAMA